MTAEKFYFTFRYMEKNLKHALEIIGGPAALARQLGISKQAVGQWPRVPAERVLDVVRACDGGITRHQLRPDIYPDDSQAAA